MKLAFKDNMIISLTILLLVVTQSTHQYLYSCDSNATCGCSTYSASVSRIVGGESAGTSTWAWAVSISIAGRSLCGGTILSSSWIITAAHCVTGQSPSQVIVYAGSNVRFSGQDRVASSIVVHPGYNSVTSVNDIALIRLSTPLTMSGSTVKAICIPSVDSSTLSAGEWPQAGLYVVAVGWGTLWEGGSLPTYLQQVTLQTIDYRAPSCSGTLNNQQKQLCAGVVGGGKDTCQGDSGGPLMMFTTSNQWVLIGVTSYGDGCARANAMGVYTRVAAYQDWISQTTSGAYTTARSSDATGIDPHPSSSTLNRNSAIPFSPLSFVLYSLFFIVFYLS